MNPNRNYTLVVANGTDRIHWNPTCIINAGNSINDVKQLRPRDLKDKHLCKQCFGTSDYGIYMALAMLFNDVTGISEFDYAREEMWKDKVDIISEEMDELEEVVGDIGDGVDVSDESRIIEELVDILVTVFTCADAMDVDLYEAYRLKMLYNLHKTGDEVEDGKVQDDVDINKPSFKGVSGLNG